MMNKIEAFLADIADVCEKHQLVLLHEDEHGAFKVGEFDGRDLDHLMEAYPETEVKGK